MPKFQKPTREQARHELDELRESLAPGEVRDLVDVDVHARLDVTLKALHACREEFDRMRKVCSLWLRWSEKNHNCDVTVGTLDNLHYIATGGFEIADTTIADATIVDATIKAVVNEES